LHHEPCTDGVYSELATALRKAQEYVDLHHVEHYCLVTPGKKKETAEPKVPQVKPAELQEELFPDWGECHAEISEALYWCGANVTSSGEKMKTPYKWKKQISRQVECKTPKDHGCDSHEVRIEYVCNPRDLDLKSEFVDGQFYGQTFL